MKSTLCRWVRREKLREPVLSGRVWELDGMWTRSGPKEMKVVRDGRGVALAPFASQGEVIDQAWWKSRERPLHLVSDDARAIAAGIQMVYGRQMSHQLCHFHLLREYRRNVGWEEWREAKALPNGASMAEADGHATQIISLTGSEGLHWCRKALSQELRHLQTREKKYQITSRPERQNREYRKREKLGTVWSPHNLLALLQNRGLTNQTT